MGALLGTWVTSVEVFTVEKDQYSCYCLVAKNMDEKNMLHEQGLLFILIIFQFECSQLTLASSSDSQL